MPVELEPEERVTFVTGEIKFGVQDPYSLIIDSVPATVEDPRKYTECLAMLSCRGYCLTKTHRRIGD